jgi:hypothetical protein
MLQPDVASGARGSGRGGEGEKGRRGEEEKRRNLTTA